MIEAKIVIENAPYIDQVYERLLDLISTGELKPGGRIRQWVLAEHLGVSRQPISHALQLLKHQGLVKEAGKQGVQVTPLDFRHLADLYDVRGLVEEKAAYLAALRVKTHQASSQEIHALRDALSQDRQEVWREKDGTPRTAFACHQYSETCKMLAHDARLVEPLEQLFGESVYIHQFKVYAKAALTGDV